MQIEHSLRLRIAVIANEQVAAARRLFLLAGYLKGLTSKKEMKSGRWIAPWQNATTEDECLFSFEVT